MALKEYRRAIYTTHVTQEAELMIFPPEAAIVRARRTALPRTTQRRDGKKDKAL